MKKLVVLFIFSLLFVKSGDLSAFENSNEELTSIEITPPKNLKPLGGGYAKDNFRVYYHGEVVEDASSSSFKYLDGGYGKDNWRVFQPLIPPKSGQSIKRILQV